MSTSEKPPTRSAASRETATKETLRAAAVPRVLPEKMWRCDCGGEALGVSFYDWGDGTKDWFIEVWKMPARYSWSWRWRNALNLLIGREVVIDSVSLDRFKATEFVEFMQASIAQAQRGGPA